MKCDCNVEARSQLAFHQEPPIYQYSADLMAPVLPKASMTELEARSISSKLTESCTAKEFLMDTQLPKKSIADLSK